jgi:hypothetical protein
MDYWINTRVGVVHADGCASLRAIRHANLGTWDPTKAHLSPGVTACPACLTRVPAVAPAPVGITDEEWEAIRLLADESPDMRAAEALWPGFANEGGYVLRLGVEALLRSRGH